MTPATTFPPITETLQCRSEVYEFTKAAEFLLSPVMHNPPLTAEECSLIRDYVMSLSHAKHPWSKGLPIKYT